MESGIPAGEEKRKVKRRRLDDKKIIHPRILTAELSIPRDTSSQTVDLLKGNIESVREGFSEIISTLGVSVPGMEKLLNNKAFMRDLEELAVRCSDENSLARFLDAICHNIQVMKK